MDMVFTMVGEYTCLFLASNGQVSSTLSACAFPKKFGRLGPKPIELMDMVYTMAGEYTCLLLASLWSSKIYFECVCLSPKVWEAWAKTNRADGHGVHHGGGAHMPVVGPNLVIRCYWGRVELFPESLGDWGKKPTELMDTVCTMVGEYTYLWLAQI